VGPLLMNTCDGLQDVMTNVSSGLVAVVLGAKSGFPWETREMRKERVRKLGGGEGRRGHRLR
jgi:hypothetical protein